MQDKDIIRQETREFDVKKIEPFTLFASLSI